MINLRIIYYNIVRAVCVYRSLCIFLLIVCHIFSTSSLEASIVTVPGDYATIQEAVDAAVTGDHIIVSPGIYYENIVVGKDMTLCSIDPTSDTIRSTTIIDGGQNGSVVRFNGWESEYCRLEGFTICNGLDMQGGGINGNGTYATIINNFIEYNSASSGGGGLADCNGLIRDNSILHNHAMSYGGGLYSCNGIIENNVISDNKANWYGGGLLYCMGLIQNNTICGNWSIHGGGFYGCQANIINCIIAYNRGLGYYEASDWLEPKSLEYCLFFQNEGGDYFDYDTYQVFFGNEVNALPEVNDCISFEPQLVDKSTSDYHLLMTSQCIDAGGSVSLTADFEGDIRPWDAVSWEFRGDGSHIDIGADEYIGSVPVYTPTPTPTPTPIETPDPYAPVHIEIDWIYESKDSTILSSGGFNFITNRFYACRSYDYSMPVHILDGDTGIDLGIGLDLAGIELGSYGIFSIGVDEQGVIYGGNPTTPMRSLTRWESETSSPTQQYISGMTFPRTMDVVNYGTDTIIAFTGAGDYGDARILRTDDGENFYLHDTTITGLGKHGIAVSIKGDRVYVTQGYNGDIPIRADKDDSIWEKNSEFLPPADRLYSPCPIAFWDCDERNVVFCISTRSPTSNDCLFAIDGDSGVVLSCVPLCVNICDYGFGTIDLKADSKEGIGAFIAMSGFTGYICGKFSFSWTHTSPSSSFGFETGDDGWEFAGTVDPFDIPSPSLESGSIGLSPLGSSNCFSYWHSPALGIDPGRVYRARWLVSSTVTNPDNAVQFRLRVNQRGIWSEWDTIINSNLGYAPCVAQPKYYDVFFDPKVSGTDDDAVIFSFDILSFDMSDMTDSWLYLDEISIDQVTFTSGTSIARYDFSGSTSGWSYYGSITPFDEPFTVIKPGSIGLCPAGSVNCFSYWSSPDFHINDKTVYRIIALVGATTTQSDTTPQFRLRVNQKGSWRAWSRVVNSNLDTAPSLYNPKFYNIFMQPTVTGIDDQDVTFSFDLLSFDYYDDCNSWLFLEDVSIEETTIYP